MAEKKLSLAGQQAYLWALETHWPEMLETLRTDVSPSYLPILFRAENGQHYWLMPETIERLKSQPDRKPILDALTAWAHRFRVTEEWILDTALNTISIYSPRQPGGIERDDWHWRYQVRGYHPRFTPELERNFWYPPETGQNETWDDFKSRMESQFSAQLAAYRRVIETRFATRKEQERLTRDAELTVRYQKGESIADIVQTIDIGSLVDLEQSVFRAIQRFAKDIELNLRRRGARFKGTVQPRA